MSTATATFRTGYSNNMTDITGSPKVATKSANTGLSQLNNPFLNRQNQAPQQTGAMPHYGGGAEKCARCSKNVYLAEKKVGAGRSFHSKCFSCQTCNRKLDATTLSEHKGEIFCKTCYTRQFGVHGLISGVTMSTEQPAREVRHSRRSSYGSDLDAPVITHQPNRQRAHSNDNSLRGEHSALQHDELPKIFPWRNDVIPEQSSPPTNKINTGLNTIVDQSHSRPASQIGFDRVIESTNTYRQSSHTGETDRQKYGFEDAKTPYPNGTSAVINTPVISPPKRSTSHIERIEMPTVPTRHEERSRSPSPSPVSTNNYREQISREHPTDISDNFSRLTLNENQRELNHPTYSHNNISTDPIASTNPLFKQSSSYSSTTEHKEINLNRNNSHESWSSAAANSNRSPSPTSGYASSSIHGDVLLRDSTSPPSTHASQNDYLNIRSSHSTVNDHRSSSPHKNEQKPSAATDFVSKTSHVPSPTMGGKYSTLAALVKPHRPLSELNKSSDDEFDD